MIVPETSRQKGGKASSFNSRQLDHCATAKNGTLLLCTFGHYPSNLLQPIAQAGSKGSRCIHAPLMRAAQSWLKTFAHKLVKVLKSCTTVFSFRRGLVCVGYR